MKSRIRASVVCIHQSKILVFKGIDPSSGRAYWFLPGGKIEENEKPWECCAREALEETGYKVNVAPESEIIAEYSHWWDDVFFDCKTYFYRGFLAEGWREPGEVTDAEYNKGPSWLPIEAAESAFGYTPEILHAVLKLCSVGRASRD